MTKRISNDIWRRFRRTLGFTQKEFAKLVGVESRSQLSRLERGERIPRLDQVIRSSVLLGTPIADLVPKAWRNALNGLWEDVSDLQERYGRASSPQAREHATFLAKVVHEVEREEEHLPAV